ncbi:MAG TPA: S8 family serine peptidase [Thermoanaerobaculia bacterium]
MLLHPTSLVGTRSSRPWRAARINFLVLLLAHAALADGVSRDVVERVRERASARVIVLMRQSRAIDGFGALQTVPVAWGSADDAAVARFASDPNVVAVDLDVSGRGGDAESNELIRADVAQQAGYTGAGVTVAVLDSGFDPNSVDLAGVVVDEQCFCQNADGGCCPNRQATQSGAGAARDEAGHGTNVTGIIASRGIKAPVGVAPGVKVVEVRVLDQNNRFSSISQVLQGLSWVATNHPEVRAVNLSLYTDQLFPSYCDNAASWTQAFSQLVTTMRSHGTAVFACAGNDSSSTTMGAPACIQPVIAMGAVFDRGANTQACNSGAGVDVVACFSDSDDALDLLAPGVSVTSTGLNAVTSTYTGTSQATPHGTASAAVLFAMRPSLSVDEMERTLKATGRPIVDARNGVTRSRIDLFAAVEALMAQTRQRAVRH